jgi:hypothetical protein
MKQQVTIFTFITNYDCDYIETKYFHSELDMSSTKGFIYVGQQSVTVEVPDDIHAFVDAHLIEIKSKERLTLEAQKAEIESRLAALTNED